MNTRKWLIVSGTVILVMLALAVGISLAQEPEPPVRETGVEGEMDVAAITPGAIPIQGRLTDDSGNPLDGTYDLTFSLYEVASGGTALCSDTNSVSVDDGLFSSYMDYCYDDLYGQKVWLGIEVGSDGEMTDRQVIYPVPYALTLKPGAIISDTRDGILTVRSTGSGDKDAFFAYAGGTGEAVTGEATDGMGVYGRSVNGNGVYGYADNSSGNNVGVYGRTDSTSGFGVVGVQTGYSTSDIPSGEWEPGGFFGGRYGVIGVTKEAHASGVFGLHLAASGGGSGVKGMTDSDGGTGVFGYAGSPSGYTYGVYGGTSSPDGYGVCGSQTSGGGTGAGVYGNTSSYDGWAGRFYSAYGNGIRVSVPVGKVGLEVIDGTKNAVVRTADGSRLLYTEESTEVWFTDYGFGELQDGVAVISIDPIFAQTVNLEDEPYHVFVQVYGNAEVYVTDRTSTQFEVRLRDGGPNVEFSYRIVAKRLGYEDHRLERSPWDDNDPNLYPEKSDLP